LEAIFLVRLTWINRTSALSFCWLFYLHSRIDEELAKKKQLRPGLIQHADNVMTPITPFSARNTDSEIRNRGLKSLSIHILNLWYCRRINIQDERRL